MKYIQLRGMSNWTTSNNWGGYYCVQNFFHLEALSLLTSGPLCSLLVQRRDKPIHTSNDFTFEALATPSIQGGTTFLKQFKVARGYQPAARGGPCWLWTPVNHVTTPIPPNWTWNIVLCSWHVIIIRTTTRARASWKYLTGLFAKGSGKRRVGICNL